MAAKTTDERSTPQGLFDYANAKYGPFELDVCCTLENRKCARYYTKESDGLQSDWFGKVWCNPPYSRNEQIRWVDRAFRETEMHRSTDLVCMLLPADTSTRLWHDYIWDAEKNQPRPYVTVEFLKGRVKFNGSKTAAKFGSALVVFRRA